MPLLDQPAVNPSDDLQTTAMAIAYDMIKRSNMSMPETEKQLEDRAALVRKIADIVISGTKPPKSR